MNFSSPYEHISIALVGWKISCKASMIEYLKYRYNNQYFKNDQNKPAIIGSTTININININRENYDVYVSDTYSKQEYYPNAIIYLKYQKGYLLVYDIEDRKSFLELPKYLSYIRQAKTEENAVIMLLGVFCEITENRDVFTEEAYRYAKKENILFAELSAKTGENASTSFDMFFIEIIKKFFSTVIQDTSMDENDSYIRRKIQDQLIIEKQHLQINDKFFVYQNENYPFNFYFMKKMSTYVYERKEEFEKCDIIPLQNEFDFFADISPDSIKSFINFTKYQVVHITNANAIGIHSLSIKFNVSTLVERVEKYFSRHYLELINDLFSEKEKVMSKISLSYETIISKFLAPIILKYDNDLLSLPISYLHRIISKCSFMNKQEEKVIENFIIKIINLHGNSTYSLFINLNIGQEDHDFLQQLLIFSNEVSNTGPLIAHILSQMKSEIDELKDKMKIVCDTVTMAKISPEKIYISKGLFQGFKQLREVNIPPSIEVIDDYAFDNCEMLAQIVLPDALVKIGNFAFSGCFSLAKITIPLKVQSIGSNAFRMCLLLKQIVIPSSVKSIGSLAFSDCKSLKYFTISTEFISIQNDILAGCAQLKEITIPQSFDIRIININSNVKIIRKNLN